MNRSRLPDKHVVDYFANQSEAQHRQFIALRSFLYDGKPADEVAVKSGYSVTTIYTLARNFKIRLKECNENGEDPFFKSFKPGKKKTARDESLIDTILNLRKKQLSVPDIKVILDGMNYEVSESFVYNICDENGFARLPKRSKDERNDLLSKSKYAEVLNAPVSEMISFSQEEQFSTKGVGILCFLPFIKCYGIDKIIEESFYPETKQIGKLNSILAFLALKLTNVERYNQDDSWCMDRGLGMFAGLNVLPKTS